MNYERLDITKNPFETKWKILPINNYYSLFIPRTYTAVTVIKNHNCEEEEEDEDKPNEYFLFFGGSYNATAQSTVITFSEEKYKQINLIILYL